MIKMTEYAKRRKALMQKIGNSSLFILPAAKEVMRNHDATYPFRQNSDFYYLTGFDEPDAVLVLAPKRRQGEYILFNRIRNPDREIWDGPRAGQEGAKQDYLADEAYPIEEFETLLPEILADRESIYYRFGSSRSFDSIMINALNHCRAKIRTGVQSPDVVHDIESTLHEMRLYKSDAEIECMQKAVDISTKAHIRAMQVCKPGLNESQLEAELNYEFQKNGARFPAYGSIVGAGRNSCILHYVKNDQKIENGDVVLIDAGAEYQNYASDITRTFPANGKFTGEQRAIYEIVLASQLAAIKAIKPGASWQSAQDIIVKIITQGLVDLGILKGSVDGLIEKQAYFKFYMHRSGHWLGLDVHDVGRYRVKNKWRPLEAGMVLTVEPGIYIGENHPSVAKRWHNIGVRIEDDVVVTKAGHRVLSADIPKSIPDIEALMA